MPASKWEVEVRPYAWVLFFHGDSTLGANKADIDTNLFEIIDEADELYAFMSYQEARRGKLGLFADVFWSKVNVGTSTIRTGNPIAGLDVALVARADVWQEMAIVEPGVAYEIFRRTTGGSYKDPQPSSTTAIDIIGGIRYWYLQTEIDLDVTATVSIPALGLSRTGGGRISADKSFDWWDPFIGLRLRHNPAPGKELFVKADVGGFDVGSDFTWQAQAGYSFQTKFLGHDMIGFLGYRALYIDYDEGSGSSRFGLDLLTHGPVVGTSIRW